MENRNTTQESSTNERDRIRKAARALIEECRRKHDARIMSEATVSTYNRLAGQTMFTPEGKSFFRGSENNGKETKKDTGVYPQKIEVPGFPGVCVRLIPGAPYYLK